MGHTTSPVFNYVQLGQYYITPPAQNKIMERGANSCLNLNPTWKVQTPLTSYQIDPEKTLVGNIEGNNRGESMPKSGTAKAEYAPQPPNPLGPWICNLPSKIEKIGVTDVKILAHLNIPLPKPLVTPTIPRHHP